MSDKKIKVGITHGDINGISYEVILKALSDPRICELCIPIVYGHSKIAGYYKKSIPSLDNFTFNIISSAAEASNKRPNMINCISEDAKLDVGQSTFQAGEYAVASLNAAIRDLESGAIDAVVTCPINKANVQNDKFEFIGHTEYLASRFGEEQALMFMISDELKVGLVTVHEPLSEVSGKVTCEEIVRKIRMMRKSLIKDFGVNDPKIAVLALNPHAGDNGLIGNEESEIIIPAIQTAKEEGILAFGPYSADGFFAAEKYRLFDAVLAMYHDQGLIPFKTLAGMRGVNFTAGLSVIRTSPDHGVAYDIAGQNVADPQSLREAIYNAIDIYRYRRSYKEIFANPLPYYYKEIGGKDESVSDVEAKTGAVKEV